MPKSDLATISPLLLMVGLLLPLFASNSVNEHPMKTFLWGIKAKLISSFVLWIILSFASQSYADPDNVSFGFLTMLTIGMVANECFGTIIFVSAMTFFSKISDPTIGGSYMTLLNTIANWGSKWPNVTILWLLPKLTINLCENEQLLFYNLFSCSKTSINKIIDGYTILVFLCTAIGILWIFTHKKLIVELETIHASAWKIKNTYE